MFPYVGSYKAAVNVGMQIRSLYDLDFNSFGDTPRNVIAGVPSSPLRRTSVVSFYNVSFIQSQSKVYHNCQTGSGFQTPWPTTWLHTRHTKYNTKSHNRKDTGRLKKLKQQTQSPSVHGQLRWGLGPVQVSSQRWLLIPSKQQRIFLYYGQDLLGRAVSSSCLF